MNRIIRTVLASVGAVAVVSGGAWGVAYATTPTSTPAQTTTQGPDLASSIDDVTAQIDALEKDLADSPAPLPSATATPQAADPTSAAPATRAAAPRTTTKTAAAPAPAPATTHHESDHSGDSEDKESDD